MKIKMTQGIKTSLIIRLNLSTHTHYTVIFFVNTNTGINITAYTVNYQVKLIYTYTLHSNLSFVNTNTWINTKFPPCTTYLPEIKEKTQK